MSEGMRVIILTVLAAMSGTICMNLSAWACFRWMDRHHIDYLAKFRYSVATIMVSIIVTMLIGLPLLYMVNEALKSIS